MIMIMEVSWRSLYRFWSWVTIILRVPVL